MTLLDDLRGLYLHAGLKDEAESVVEGWKSGAVEARLGKKLRAMRIQDDVQAWRRVWAAKSATRRWRKRIQSGAETEQDVAEWIAWGLRQ